jgi:hypothetical protein
MTGILLGASPGGRVLRRSWYFHKHHLKERLDQRDRQPVAKGGFHQGFGFKTTIFPVLGKVVQRIYEKKAL